MSGLQRRTPLAKVAKNPKRKPTFTCSKQRCDKPPTVFPWCAMHARREADALFARYIKARDRRCRSCGITTWPECAHVVSRRYHAVRWDPSNAVQLCAPCHKRFTEDPLAWDDWCIEQLGADELYQLKLRARRGGMPDLAYTIAELRAMLKEVAA